MEALNRCEFIGNAGRAPEIKTFENGDRLATVTIAVTDRYKGREGNTVENTIWVPLVFGGPLADIAEKYITRGTQVFVAGRLNIRSYTNAEGVKKNVTEVRVQDLKLLGSRPAAASAGTVAPAPAPAAKSAPASDGSDDLPFD